jgi:hypothetical protein
MLLRSAGAVSIGVFLLADRFDAGRYGTGGNKAVALLPVCNCASGNLRGKPQLNPGVLG